MKDTSVSRKPSSLVSPVFSAPPRLRAKSMFLRAFALAIALLSSVFAALAAPSDATPATAATETAATSAAIAKLIAAVPTPEIVAPQKGTGVVTGKVRTSDGHPLANVRVSATAVNVLDPSFSLFRSQKEPKLEETIMGMIKYFRLLELGKREGLTDTNGVYTIKELADTVYTMSAQVDGYSAAPNGRAWQIHPDATCDFTAETKLELPVTVCLPDGSRAARATITIEKRDRNGGSNSHSELWTPDAPRIPVSAGTYYLTAQGNEQDEVRSEPQKIRIKKNEQPAALTLQLKIKPLLKGRIILPAGTSPGNYPCQVYLLKLPAGTTPDADRLRREGKTVWAANNDYRFEDVAPGNYLIGVGAAGNQNAKICVTEKVTVTNGVTKQDFVLPTPPPEDVLVVWVRGPNGDLLDDVSFSMERQYPGGGGSSGGAQADRRDDGAWRILRSEDDPNFSSGTGMKTIVSASTDEYGEKKVEYAKTDREKTIQFGAPAALKATISGYAGSVYEERLWATLEKPKEAEELFSGRRMVGRGNESGNISPDGSFALGPVETGDYEIVLSVKTDQWQTQPIARKPVKLQAGENLATVEIPMLYALTVSFEQAGGTIALEPGAGNRQIGNQRQKNVDKNKNVTFENLPVGKYRVRSYGPKQGVMSVDLTGTTNVVFQPDLPANAVKPAVRPTDPKNVRPPAPPADEAVF